MELLCRSPLFLKEGDNIAYPHVNGKRYPLAQEEPQASGSIFSSVDEMANWVMMYLNNGKFNGEQILSENVINDLSILKAIIIID